MMRSAQLALLRQLQQQEQHSSKFLLSLPKQPMTSNQQTRITAHAADVQ